MRLVQATIENFLVGVKECGFVTYTIYLTTQEGTTYGVGGFNDFFAMFKALTTATNSVTQEEFKGKTVFFLFDDYQNITGFVGQGGVLYNFDYESLNAVPTTTPVLNYREDDLYNDDSDEAGLAEEQYADIDEPYDYEEIDDDYDSQPDACVRKEFCNECGALLDRQGPAYTDEPFYHTSRDLAKGYTPEDDS